MDTSAFDRSNCPTLRIAWSERVPLIMRQIFRYARHDCLRQKNLVIEWGFHRIKQTGRAATIFPEIEQWLVFRLTHDFQTGTTGDAVRPESLQSISDGYCIEKILFQGLKRSFSDAFQMSRAFRRTIGEVDDHQAILLFNKKLHRRATPDRPAPPAEQTRTNTYPQLNNSPISPH